VPEHGVSPCPGWMMTPSLRSGPCCKPPHPACAGASAAPGCSMSWRCLLRCHRPVPKGPLARRGGRGILQPRLAAGICAAARGGKRLSAAGRAPARGTGTLHPCAPTLPAAGVEPGTQHTQLQPPWLLGLRPGVAGCLRPCPHACRAGLTPARSPCRRADLQRPADGAALRAAALHPQAGGRGRGGRADGAFRLHDQWDSPPGSHLDPFW